MDYVATRCKLERIPCLRSQIANINSGILNIVLRHIISLFLTFFCIEQEYYVSSSRSMRYTSNTVTAKWYQQAWKLMRNVTKWKNILIQISKPSICIISFTIYVSYCTLQKNIILLQIAIHKAERSQAQNWYQE